MLTRLRCLAVGAYAVDPEALRYADSVLSAATAQARAALHSLRGQESATTWSSPAGAAFHAGWEQWSDGCGQLLTALDELAVALGLAGRAYAETDAAVQVAAGG